MSEFIPFAKPSIGTEEIQAVSDCLTSGWLATGPRVSEFEKQLKTYFSAKHVVALQSGTAALHLALLALNLPKNSEVITTPLTFVATLNTIVLAGAKPVLVDIDPQTFNIDVDQIEAAITENTRAIMPVHFAGLPVDLDRVYSIAEQYNLRVIEDCAHAMGSSYKDQRIGSMGDTQIFSFHPNKNMTAGEGGCIVTRDQALADYARVMSFHGLDKRLHNDENHLADVLAPGYKYNMMDIQAALGLAQLPKLDAMNQKRAELAQHYREVLSTWPQFQLAAIPEYSHVHSHHIFTPVLNENYTHSDRQQLIDSLKKRSIGAGVHYEATHLYRFYQQQYGYRKGDFPNAESICQRIITLPLFADMSLQQFEHVIHSLEDSFGA